MSEPLATGSLLSVNVAEPKTVKAGKGEITTAIWKLPVEGPVAARGVNLEGDRQADLTVHGGYDKAIYSYASEDYEWWETQLGRPLAPGSFGENLTTGGIDVTGAVVGEIWRVGAVELEVSEPRLPCAKLALKMDDLTFVKRFGAGRRPGAYLRILVEGTLQAGDQIEVLSRPDHDVTVGMVSEAALHDHSLAARVAEAPQLSRKWLDWAHKQLAR